MNNSITRERLEELAAGQSGFNLRIATLEESQQLARMVLATLDSEPVAWTWHYREQWHVTNDKRRAEFVAKDGDVAVLPLYRHAQQPVVMDDLSIFEAAIEECKTCDSIDERAWNHGVLVVMAKYDACRAAMLAASPQSPGSEPATVPGKWIPVSERIPIPGVDVLVAKEFFGPGELPDEAEKDAQAYFDRKYAPLDEELMALHKWFWEQSEAERAAAGIKVEAE